MIRKIFAGVCLLGMASGAFANTTGALDSSDATWDGCGSGTGCFYDAIQFTVDTDGAYTITTFYDGDVTLDENLDGVIEIYEGAFDPSLPGTNAIAFDDDYTGGFGCVGSNCSQIAGVSLTAGTSYFLVISSFTNVPNSFGSNEGPWEIAGADGPGTVTFKAPVPVPGALLLLASGLLGLGAARRRK